MEEVTYIEETKAKAKFDFVFEEVKINGFSLSSSFLSEYFRTRGAISKRIVWFFIFIAIFTTIFCCELLYKIVRFVFLKTIQAIKFVGIWIFDLLGTIFKFVLKKLLAPICILVGLTICYYLYSLGVLSEIGIWLRDFIYMLIEGT